jgi:hypothetical protein
MENSDNKNIATRSTEVENIENEARVDAGFDAFLVFKKGVYFIDEKEVPLGTEYVAHAIGWTKVWRKYDGEQVTERRVYRVAKGEKPPEREDLDDWPGMENWPIDEDGKAYDPWALQYLLPLEDLTTGETKIFTTRSVGGRRAVADLCTAWAKRRKKIKNCGQPKVKLAGTDMPSKKWGLVKRPLFQITGWDDGEPAEEVEVLPPDDGGGEFGSSSGGGGFDDATPFAPCR